jgi:RNA polymerase primary sigma factor
MRSIKSIRFGVSNPNSDPMTLEAHYDTILQPTTDRRFSEKQIYVTVNPLVGAIPSLDSLTVMMIAENQLHRSFDDVTTDPVRDYLRSIGHAPLLAAEDEVNLAIRIEAGILADERLESNREICATERRELLWLVHDGKQAFGTFVQCNLRLVVSVARRYIGRGLPFLDVIQEGNLGLVRAVQKFDYRAGNKFSTYAIWWIRQSILRGLADSARLIRIPAHTVERIESLDRARRDFTGSHGRPPTLAELATTAGITEAEVVALEGTEADVISLAITVGDDGDAELGDLIEDGDSLDPSETAELAMRSEDLERCIQSLTPRDAKVIRLRFGLDGSRPMTLDEVGEIYGITRERVRQLESRGLARLRTPELHEYLAS